MCEVTKKAHHSICLLLGLRKPELCPECGSTEWFRHEEFIKTYKDYTGEGCHQDYRGEDYMFTTYQCDDCGHDCD